MRFGLFGIKSLPSPTILETWADIMQVLIIFCFLWHTWDMSILLWVMLNALTPFLRSESSILTAAYQAGWSGCLPQLRDQLRRPSLWVLWQWLDTRTLHILLSLLMIPAQLYCDVLSRRQAQWRPNLVTYYVYPTLQTKSKSSIRPWSAIDEL